MYNKSLANSSNSISNLNSNQKVSQLMSKDSLKVLSGTSEHFKPIPNPFLMNMKPVDQEEYQS